MALAQAEYIRGNYVVSLLKYRRVAADYPESSKVLEGWSKAARKTKGWGESLRVARMWGEIDSSAHAHLHLARMQRAVGKSSKAVATLRSLLEREPTNSGAKALLSRYGGAVPSASVPPASVPPASNRIASKTN